MEREEINFYVEIGCGKVLNNLNKRIGVKGFGISVNKVDDLDTLSQMLESSK